MITKGYANTKSEAIRLAILSFGESYNIENILIERKLDKIDNEIKKGKSRVLNAKETLGIYAKHVK